MSDIKARYVGHPDGTYLPQIPVTTEGEPPRSLFVPHGGELPHEIDGHPVSVAYRDSLLEQKDAWTRVTRDKTTTAAKADEKKGA